MVKKAKDQPKSAELTPDKIQGGIVKLERRIKELEAFDVSTIQERWDPKIKALTTKILPSLRSGRMRELSSEQGKCAPRGENQEFETDGPPAHCSTRAFGTE